MGARYSPPRWRLRIAREGYPVVGIGVAAAVVLYVAGWGTGAGGMALLTVLSGAFFRDPERVTPPGEHRVVAPADGRVIAVGESRDTRFLEVPALRISIFMSPLNVHVNRAPVSGTVERIEYRPGRYFRAFAQQAPLRNEQNAIVLRDRSGRQVCFVQIAGFLARRIVCYLRETMEVRRGERCGMIVFGSRADVYLPGGAAVRVAVGDRTRAGETVLAEWSP